MTEPVLMWFRTDLRIHDNPALHAAVQQGLPVVAIVFETHHQWARHGLGPRKINLMRAAMASLRNSLAARNIPLLIETVTDFEASRQRIAHWLQALGARQLFFNNEYEVNERRRDIMVCRDAAAQGIDVHRFHDQCLLAPGSVNNKAGLPFRVYTPFRKAWMADAGPALTAPLPAPAVQAPFEWPDHLLMPVSSVAEPNVDPLWSASEDDAHQQLQAFIDERARQYHLERDFPGLDTTSRLSVPLSLGLLSPRQCLYAAVRFNDGRLDGGRSGFQTWINELVWREFYRHLLVAFPELCKHRAFKPETEVIRWRDAPDEFAAWCEGRTGYPIVDAAQQQLLQEGWMHNRLRMISAMFLTKHLLIDWRQGEAFFNQYLLDADLASNNGGWQWSASTGADGAPWFRIFNPLLQSRKFDTTGEFIARFVPALASLPPDSRHEPDGLQRRRCGYPTAIVEHSFGRQRALDAFGVLGKPVTDPAAHPELPL